MVFERATVEPPFEAQALMSTVAALMAASLALRSLNNALRVAVMRLILKSFCNMSVLWFIKRVYDEVLKLSLSLRVAANASKAVVALTPCVLNAASQSASICKLRRYGLIRRSVASVVGKLGCPNARAYFT